MFPAAAHYREFAPCDFAFSLAPRGASRFTASEPRARTARQLLDRHDYTIEPADASFKALAVDESSRCLLYRQVMVVNPWHSRWSHTVLSPTTSVGRIGAKR